MTRKERRARRERLKANLSDHLNLSANSELPEVHDPRFARMFIFTMCSVLAALLFWSANTPVVELATGEGVLKTELAIERLEHVDGGRVAVIDVSARERIAQGDRLIAFETTSLEREVQKLQATLVALEAERLRLLFVLDGGAISDEMPGDESGELTAILFWTEQRFLTARLNVLAAERAAGEATLVGLRAQRENLNEETTLLGSRLEQSERGLANGLIPTVEFERQQREMIRAQRSILTLDAEIIRQQGEIEQSLLREAELIAQRRREAAQRLADLDSRLSGVRLSIEDYRERIARADVRANVGGTVMSLSVSNVNEVIAPGELIAEIIPDDSRFEADVQIPASRIGSVEVGMQATVKVLTYDFTRFGQLIGQVSEISPSSLQNEQGETVFDVTITFPEEQLDFTPGFVALTPGMTVTADVMSDSKTILTYLLKPLELLRDRAFSET